jgi:hypothetical protein
MLRKNGVGGTFAVQSSGKFTSVARRLSAYYTLQLGEDRMQGYDEVTTWFEAALEYVHSLLGVDGNLFMWAMDTVSLRDSLLVSRKSELRESLSVGIKDFVIHDYFSAIFDILIRRLFIYEKTTAGENGVGTVVRSILERIVTHGFLDPFEFYPVQDVSRNISVLLEKILAAHRSEMVALKLKNPILSEESMIDWVPVLMTGFHVLLSSEYIPMSVKTAIKNFSNTIEFMVDNGVAMDTVYNAVSSALSTGVGELVLSTGGVELLDVRDHIRESPPTITIDGESIYDHIRRTYSRK